jgi:predicted transcriptional regulator
MILYVLKYTYKGYVMTIRKNFLFDDEVAKHLEEIAKIEGKTQTQIAQEAIEEKYKSISIQNKLTALDEIFDSFHGLLTEVDSKASRVEHAMDKYGK